MDVSATTGVPDTAGGIDTVDARVALICRQQWGLVTLEQARAVGMTIHQVRHRCERGLLESVRRGVYRARAVAPTTEQDVLATVLAAGDGAFASHDTACWLWELPLPGALRLEITTPWHRRPRTPGVAWHRSSSIGHRDVVAVRGIPSCTVERAIADVSARYPLDALGAMVASAVARELTTPHRLARVAGALPPVGVRDRQRLRAAVRAAAAA